MKNIVPILVVSLVIGCGKSRDVGLEKLQAETLAKLEAVEAELAAVKAERDGYKVTVDAHWRSEGIGITRQEVADFVAAQFGVAFAEEVGEPGRLMSVTTKVGGVFIRLWGPPENLTSIMVIGSFRGDYGVATANVIRPLCEKFLPTWTKEKRVAWFTKVAASDPDLDVNTLVDGLRVGVVQAPFDKNVVVHCFTITKYPEN